MESYKLIKENGEELYFDSKKFNLAAIGGLGNPPINYVTQKTFYQDGETVTNFITQPRVLNFPLIAQTSGIDRIDYWNLRRELLDFLSPISGAMRFQITLDDHTIYELTNIYPSNGLSMDDNTYNSNRNDGRIDESLTLTAYDPIWRVSPINSTGAISSVTSANLTFPLTFPISFGSSGTVFNTTITYNGNWRSYPKITIDGPYNTCIITNTQNSAAIQLTQSISLGEQRIIDLTDPINGFSVVDQSGANKIGEVGLNTNFTQFFFAPDVTNGIKAVLNGGTASSGVQVDYYTKYLGI